MSLIIPNLYLGNQTDAVNNKDKFNVIISAINYPFEIEHLEHYPLSVSLNMKSLKGILYAQIEGSSDN